MNCGQGIAPGRLFSFMLVLGFAISVHSCQVDASPSDEPKGGSTADSKESAGEKPSSQAASEKEQGWKPLAGKWEIARFGGEGPLEINKDLIQLGFGDPLTGVRWDGDFPVDDYELRLEARRTDGFDFFTAVTFPVGKDHCSLVLGGWGGGVTGISNIDGQDASSNETTLYRQYKNDQWYRVRIRVEAKQITCWVDDVIAVELEREGISLGIRAEMDCTLPLGIANFQCDSEIRKIQWRELAAKPTGGKHSQSEESVESP